MQFYAIESSLLCIQGSLSKKLLDFFDIVNAHFFWCFIGDSLWSKLASDSYWGWSNILFVCEGRMSGSTSVPYLHKYIGTLIMNGLCNLLPTLNLIFVFDASSTQKWLGIVADWRAFSENKGLAWSSLLVVFDQEIIWDTSLVVTSHSGKGCHDKSVFELEIPESILIKKAYVWLLVHVWQKFWKDIWVLFGLSNV